MVKRRCVFALLLATLILPARDVSTQSELVIVIQSARQYHRPGCPLVRAGKDVLAMQRGQAEQRGYKSHSECDPSYVPPPPSVYVDAEGKHYHREKCEKLGKGPKRVLLEEAARKHWPCRTCKPPIRARKSGGA